MQAHRVETTLSEDGTITLHGVPFCRGERVEVIVLAAAVAGPAPTLAARGSYPLRGTPVSLRGPSEPAAEPGDWEAETETEAAG